MGRIEIHATYKRDSRRFDGFPGHKRSVGMKVLIALDESGEPVFIHISIKAMQTKMIQTTYLIT